MESIFSYIDATIVDSRFHKSICIGAAKMGFNFKKEECFLIYVNII